MSTAPPKANKAQNQAQKTQAEIKINHKQAIATNYKNQWWLPIIILVMHCAMAHAAPQEGGNEDFEFDPKLLLNGMPADLTQFSRANAIAPGTYRADVYLNQKWLANTDILMIRRTAETTTRPCLDPELVRLLQIEAPAGHGGPESSAQSNDASSRCRYWDQILGAGQADFDLSTQSLQISVPQAYLKKMGTGSIPEEMLDDGITAGSISYQFNTYHGSGSQGQSQSAYLGLNNSFNMGAWRFRNQGSFQQSSGGTHYQKIANYVNRDIFSIKSQISLGQIFTEGQLLSSFGLEGIKLSSNNQMLPESERSYGPVIRSEARSNAKVKVAQAGLVIYETVVPPGPFVLTDLHPVGMGGELEVTITESDGSQRSFNVAYSSMATLVPSGQWRYSAAIGRVTNSETPIHASQLTVQFGLNDHWTLNGAAIISEQYSAVLTGAGASSPYGTLMVNALASQFRLKDKLNVQASGLNYSWSKSIDSIRSNISLQGQHYSSTRFHGLQEAVSLMNSARNTSSDNWVGTRPRNIIQGNLSRQIGSTSTFFLTASRTDFGSRRSPSTGFQLSYTGRTNLGIFNINAGREYSGDSKRSVTTRFSIGLTLPIDHLFGLPAYANSLYQYDSKSGASSQLGALGSFGEDMEGNYNLSVTKNQSGTQSSANLGYRNSFSQIGFGLMSGRGQTQASLTSTGAVVIHAGGVTLTPSLGDTIGLAWIEGGQGSRITGLPSGMADRQGYLVVPFLMPYNMNTVDLDLTHASPNLELNDTSAKTAPTTGAIVHLKFTKSLSTTVMIKTRLPNGKNLPFGAAVTNEARQQVGVVGQSGRLLAQVTQKSGKLIVNWGDERNETCQIEYALPEENSLALPQIDSICTPPSGIGLDPQKY